MDEQRQVVAQWKRKTAKVQGEQNDLRMLLEEQTSRNALLEKRARKFDSELSLANEERKLELQSKEKLQRELDQLKSIKNQLEDQLQVSLYFFYHIIHWSSTFSPYSIAIQNMVLSYYCNIYLIYFIFS